MEKLIELLNEFNKEMWWHPWLLYEWFWVRKWDLNFIFKHSQFPFIKRLVDNDKIYREWMKWHWKLISYCLYIKSWEWDKIKEWVLLMLLSIQDNPIEFLISILK